jgi:adenosine deaminase
MPRNLLLSRGGGERYGTQPNPATAEIGAKKDAALRLKAHGETPDSVQRAVEEREFHEVRHGIAAAKSTFMMTFLADNRIRLDICPTSNVKLGWLEALAEHPIRKLYDARCEGERQYRRRLYVGSKRLS